MTYDLVVVGAGYWGAAITYEAKKKGWKVAVIDDNDEKSGSRNASGICDPKIYSSSIFSKYWPSTWDPSELDESISWLIDRGGIRTRERFWNLFAGTDPREGVEAIYIPIPETITGLAYPRVQRKIEDVSWKRLVVAAGYRTDRVLTELGISTVGVGSLGGRGILARGIPKTQAPVSVMIKPYVKHTVRSWTEGLWKVGDTAEEVFKDKNLENLRTVGRLVLDNYQEVKVNEGYRPLMDKFTVEKLTSKVVVATGGGRLGLGLSGLVAKKVLEAFR